MGRTLHYGIRGRFTPTDQQEASLYALSSTYNERYNWTCENVGLSALDYYPNWSYFKQGVNDAWDRINLLYDALINGGASRAETIRKMLNQGIISLHDPDGELRGFTKVRGNENNARAVIAFVLEASKILNNRTLSLHDEGDALYCNLIIKDGLVKPEIDKMRESIEYWKDNPTLHAGDSWDMTEAERYYAALISNPPDWRSVDQYIRPFKNGGGFEQSKPFKTIKMGLDNLKNLPDTVKGFLAEEQAESDQYYDSTTTYPSPSGD